MKLSDYIVSFLKQEGVDTLFGYQGGAITHLVDSVGKMKGVEFFTAYHEQGAAFFAEGYARISGNMGVAMATSGPGATNLITGIGSSFFDSIPCLYLTGQVNTYEYKQSEKVRQAGFQETDIVSIVKSIVKFAHMVTQPEMIRYYLEKAVYLAKSGRPGPVLLDIPMDIQRAEIEVESLCSYYDSEEYKESLSCLKQEGLMEKIDEVIQILKQSKRPVIVVGGGIRLAHAKQELTKFVQYTQVPVVSTLMGLDAMNQEDSHFVGYIGSYGNRYANLTVANADLVIVLGARLTTRQTSPNPETFARGAKIIHIDIDESELNRTVKAYRAIKCDLLEFLWKFNQKIADSISEKKYDEWLEKIKTYQKQYPSYPTQQERNTIDPNTMMKILSEKVGNDAIICTDVGQNQIWVAQSFRVKEGQRLLTSGGMGAMGFALPSAIGAYKASPNSTVIAIAGDGGIQMNIQELQTVAREKMPIKIFVLNNKTLGMIRHFQEMYFDSQYYGTMEGYSAPDFIKLGEAYGITSEKITSYEELMNLEDKLADQNSYLFEVELCKITYTIPKLSMGRPIEDQDPLVSREELAQNMIIPCIGE